MSGNTHYFSPWKLFDMKLSFVPNEKNEVLLLVALMLRRYWTAAGDVTFMSPLFTIQTLSDTISHTHSSLSKRYETYDLLQVANS